MMQENVQFYLPVDTREARDLPSTLDQYWPWIERTVGIGETGRYTWTLKTFLYLKQRGQIPVRLVTEFPSGGIVISHRDYLPLHLLPRKDVFLVCIKPDRREHPWAHHYIVQNDRDRIFSTPLAERASCVLHWPQGQLLARDATRGTRCEAAAYFGRAANLAEELRESAWKETMQSLGFTWCIVPSSQWNDYRHVDVTLSIRSLERVADPNPDSVFDTDSKPPSKLINSWMAGVPAIVGRESAYRVLRRSEFDFLQVHTAEELTRALLELRRNPSLYQGMVDNGLTRARDFSAEAVLQQWHRLFADIIIPKYDMWMRRPGFVRHANNLFRSVSYLINPVNLAGIKPYYPPKPSGITRGKPAS